MGVYNDCDYCGGSYRPEDGDHVCGREALKERIEELSEEVDSLKMQIAEGCRYPHSCGLHDSPEECLKSPMGQRFATAVKDLVAFGEVLRALVDSLPKCDLCDRPATRSPERGRERRCDKHPNVSRAPGEQFTAPDYPRAEPLRAAMKALGDGRTR